MWADGPKTTPCKEAQAQGQSACTSYRVGVRTRTAHAETAGL